MGRFPKVPVLLALSVAVFQLAACGRKIDYPPPSDRAANDFAGLLAPQTVERLEKLSRSLWQQSRDAVVVVTVESIAPETIEGYAVGLFEYWGIGDEGTDNGILILVAEKERKTRIEVGYGLEGTIPDAEASRIVRDLMLPHFRRGDYNRGVELAVQAVIGKIAAERGLEIEGLNSEAEAPAPVRRSSSAGNLSPLIFLLLVVLVLSLNVIAFRRRGAARGTASGGFWTGSGGGFGGGFSGGGFSGGFGGGMSGGGGASGGW